MAKLVSLVVKVGALVFIRHAVAVRDPAAAARRHMDHPDAAVGAARALHAHAQWLGTADRLGGRIWPWHLDVHHDELQPNLPAAHHGYTVPCYAALAAAVVNVVVSFVLSLFLNAVWSDRHKDVTVASDYA